MRLTGYPGLSRRREASDFARFSGFFLASAAAAAAEALAWVGMGSRAGQVARGITFGPVAGLAGEVRQPEVRVAFGRQASVWRAANMQRLGRSEKSSPRAGCGVPGPARSRR